MEAYMEVNAYEKITQYYITWIDDKTKEASESDSSDTKHIINKKVMGKSAQSENSNSSLLYRSNCLTQ